MGDSDLRSPRPSKPTISAPSGGASLSQVDPAGLAGTYQCQDEILMTAPGRAETSVLGAAALGRLGVLGETDEELIQGRRALISSPYFHIAISQLL